MMWMYRSEIYVHLPIPPTPPYSAFLHHEDLLDQKNDYNLINICGNGEHVNKSNKCILYQADVSGPLTKPKSQTLGGPQGPQYPQHSLLHQLVRQLN